MSNVYTMKCKASKKIYSNILFLLLLKWKSSGAHVISSNQRSLREWVYILFTQLYTVYGDWFNVQWIFVLILMPDPSSGFRTGQEFEEDYASYAPHRNIHNICHKLNSRQLATTLATSQSGFKLLPFLWIYSSNFNMLIPIHAIQKLFSVAEVHASFFLLGNPFIIKPEITFIENYLFSSYLFIKCKQLTYRVEVLEFAALLPGQTGIQKHKSRQGLGIPALVNFSHLVQSFMHCL